MGGRASTASPQLDKRILLGLPTEIVDSAHADLWECWHRSVLNAESATTTTATATTSRRRRRPLPRPSAQSASSSSTLGAMTADAELRTNADGTMADSSASSNSDGMIMSDSAVSQHGNAAQDASKETWKARAEQAITAAEKGAVVHKGVCCDLCEPDQLGIWRTFYLVGARYHLRDADYDLCEAHFGGLSEEDQALYEKIAEPSDRPRS